MRVVRKQRSPAERAAADLERQGMNLPEKPSGGVPGLPQDPTELDDSGLMQLFTEMTQWASFAAVKLAAAEVDEKYAVADFERQKAINTVANKGEKTVTTAKAKAYEDPEFLAAQEEAHRTYALRKMLESLYNATDRKAQVLSRELTRRVGREPREQRSARWSA
jgi:hypothetical protein